MWCRPWRIAWRCQKRPRIWRQTLERVRPEIVALATPAALRREVVEMAASFGAHIFCDKPLATTAEEAKAILQCVEHAEVKHAFAATHRYDPSVAWTTELLGNNTIGRLQTVDCLLRFPPSSPHQPWMWTDSLAMGGGMLNNGFTHAIAMLEKMIGSQMISVTGAAHTRLRQQPVVPAVHDVRQRGAHPHG